MSSSSESGLFDKNRGDQGSVDGLRTCGQATTSVVLGLLSFGCLFVTGIPAIIFGVLALRKIGRSDGQLSGNGFAITGLVTGSLGSLLAIPSMLVVFTLLSPVLGSLKEQAEQTSSMAKMKSISLAMATHETSQGAYPAAGNPKTGAGLSWRVHLLPYLDEIALYERFHLDEPWDGPHNMSLLPEMPEAFRAPGFEGDRRETIYLAVVRRGPEERGTNPFFGNGSTKIEGNQILDNRSRTIQAVVLNMLLRDDGK